jgi:polyphosphate kinase
MRQKFLGLIDREVEHHKSGRPAGIIAKMNSIEDKPIIRALTAASQAGVPINLVVRGFCCLRPGVIGLSENIRVVSVVGRFLEHSRIFYFRNGQQNPVDGRVEVVTPIEDVTARQRLWQNLELLLSDTRQAWDMQPDGKYVQRHPRNPEREIGTQAELMRLTCSVAPSD